VILKNPPIVVLDEATSALDAESEARIWDTLRTVFQGRTLIVITHHHAVWGDRGARSIQLAAACGSSDPSL
jgi:ABC-type multidrug transport system fused ATPase/permease subunit